MCTSDHSFEFELILNLNDPGKTTAMKFASNGLHSIDNVVMSGACNKRRQKAKKLQEMVVSNFGFEFDGISLEFRNKHGQC